MKVSKTLVALTKPYEVTACLMAERAQVSLRLPEGSLDIDTDYETARRMVEGEVSLLVVVRDGGE